MARSRFSNDNPELVAQQVDVRVRNRGGSNTSRGRVAEHGVDTNVEKTTKHIIWFSALHITLALVAVIMLGAWLSRRHGGFAWKDRDFVISCFNYHPLFMVIAFMLLSGVADILYRMLRFQNRLAVKVTHGLIQLTAFCFIVSALCAVFWYHDVLGMSHLQSAHSWIGLIIVLLVSCQWVVAFFGLLWPGFRPPVRASYLLTHKFTGRCIFVLSLVNILIGINKIGSGATMMNCLALVVILYALNGGYMLAKKAFTREAADFNEERVTVYERRTSIHSNNGRRETDENKYINIGAGAGVGGGAVGQYQSLGEDPILKESMTVGRDTFNRFHERLEKKKALPVDVAGEFVTAPTTTFAEQ